MIIFAVFPSKMRLYVRGLAAATVAAACGLGFLSGSAEATTYRFETRNNATDPTFNQLLGINSGGLISGYFGSGAAGHPNKGYLLAPPYGQVDYKNENFPGSAQTQVTGLNDNGTTVGFFQTRTLARRMTTILASLSRTVSSGEWSIPVPQPVVSRSTSCSASTTLASRLVFIMMPRATATVTH